MSRITEQYGRIKTVFNSQEVPSKTGERLRRFLQYLKGNLLCPCLLTGIESMKYFGWEARFEFGQGSENEYQELRRQRGSYKDKYELHTLDDAEVDEGWDIVVNVHRVPYRKRFVIPLSQLQAVDRRSRNYQLLNDYTVWFVNVPWG